MSACSQPGYDCQLCPRLAAFHKSNRVNHSDFYNGPVPSFGDMDAGLLVVGLAPGLKGANRTGRPFTGDYAGLVLYSALRKHGFAQGEYEPDSVGPSNGGTLFTKKDTFTLINCRITNAVRCVPPENKPETQEIKNCNAFLKAEISEMKQLKIIVTLGQISHKAVIQALGLKQSHYAFGHHVLHDVNGLQILNSYHTSRYNINTGNLTQAMFDKVIANAREVTDTKQKAHG